MAVRNSDVGKSFLGVAAIKIGSAALAVMAALLLARLLGTTEFGIYAFWLSAGTVACLPALQGLPTLVVREVARCEGDARSAVVAALLRFSDAFTWAVLLILSLLAVFWSMLRPQWTTVLWLALGSLVLQALSISMLVRSAVLRGHKHDIRGQVPSELVKPGALVLLSGLLWLLGVRHALGAMACNVVATLLGLIVAWVLIRRLPVLHSSFPPALRSARTWLTSLLPLSTVAGMQLINSQVDMLALGLLSSSTDVGVFKIASTLAIQVNFGLNVVNTVAAPRFAILFNKRDIGGLMSLNRVSSTIALVFGAAVFLVFATAAEPLIARTAGPSFVGAVAPLLILSAAHMATMWAGSTNVMLNMMRRERDVLVCAAVCLTTNIVLNVVLIPRLGTIGAAIGTASSLVIWRMTLLFFLRRRLRES